jgi:hypothetical protein
VFANVGFIAATKSLLSGTAQASFAAVQADPKLYAVLACVPVLALIGIVVQFSINKNRSFTKGAV